MLVVHLLEGLGIILGAWIISPLFYIALLLFPVIFRNPGEYLLNRQKVIEQIDEHLLHDPVFPFLYLPLHYIRQCILWIVKED